MRNNPMNEKNPNKSNPLLSSQNPWLNDNHIWLGSTLTFLRNLEKFKFPGKLGDDKRKQIVALIGKDLLVDKDLKNPQLIKAEEMPPIEKEFLMEHFLSTQDFHQAHVGEAFVLDESGEFVAILNVRDHITLQWIDCREELEKAWERLVNVEKNLTNNLNFAFSSRFGFLTSDPAQCGTGFFVYIFLHLPALLYSHQLNEVMEKYKDETIEQTGLHGDPQDMIGDIVVFHNRYTLGLTEENVLASLRTLATKLLVEEKSARLRIKQKEDSDIKDKISRAYAVLLHSYQIEAVEALNAISLLKLGLDLEWVSHTSHADLNALLFNCRRAHLLCHYGQRLTQDEIPHRRAEFIHQALKETTLHI